MTTDAIDLMGQSEEEKIRRREMAISSKKLLGLRLRSTTAKSVIL